MYDVINEKKPFEFKDLRADVSVSPIKDTDIPHRLIRKNVKVDNKTIPVLLQPKVPNLKTVRAVAAAGYSTGCLLYTSPSPRDRQKSRMPSSA